MRGSMTAWSTGILEARCEPVFEYVERMASKCLRGFCLSQPIIPSLLSKLVAPRTHHSNGSGRMDDWNSKHPK